MNLIIILLVGIVFILASSMIFCNALENFGERMNLSQGVIGSIFVAIGTALPEVIVPIIALYSNILKSRAIENNIVNYHNEVGIGAIFGPPLMLSTLSIFLLAMFVVKQRKLNGAITPEPTGIQRDLKFFSFGYFLAILLAISHNYYFNCLLNWLVILILLGSYIFYILLTLKASSKLVQKGFNTKATNKLFLTCIAKFIPSNLVIIILQAILGLTGLIFFARSFVVGIVEVSTLLSLPAFLVSVILIPIATELPEKVNSILWIRQGKDTLALANITGAMVFQGLLLPIMGILATEWKLSFAKLISSITVFIATAWIFYKSRSCDIKVKSFILNGFLYILSLLISFIIFKWMM